MDEIPPPCIVPRAEHPISRKNIDPEALKVLYRLHDHGFIAYLVGGCVRDLLLGKTPKDFDVATDAHPQQVREIFRNSRLIGRRFRIAHVYFRGGKYIEVSTFRRKSEFDDETESPPLLSENTFGTPGEDAQRRDITINGIFYSIRDFSLIDYVGGLKDLQNRVIRCIGDPEEKFHQDPVRMIRVVRHAARTGFRIEEGTYQSLLRHGEELITCSRARVRDEFFRDLGEGTARDSMELMLKSNLLTVLFPFLTRLPEGDRVNGFFFSVLEAIDRQHRQGSPFPQDFTLTVFLLPFLFECVFWQDLPPGRRGQVMFRERVRDWVMEILGPFQFTHRAKEVAIDLLGAQRIFQEFLPQQRIPWFFTRKSYYPQAKQLFDIGYRAAGEEPDRLHWQPDEKSPRKRKRRNGHRRHKHASPPPPQNP